MNEELIAYLDERFRENSKRFDQFSERFDQVYERFDQVSARFDQVSERFDQVSARFGQVYERFDEVSERFDQLEGGVRQTQVMVEDVRSNVGLVAEGVMGLNERLDMLRIQFANDLEQVRLSIRHPYSELAGRVHQLEVWRETKERDPIDMIRERFGKPPSGI